MGVTDIKATRIGFHAYRYLSETSRTGSAISLFRHGFNVSFNEDSDPGFVSIQTNGAPLHPWAIEAAAVPEVRVLATFSF